MIYSGLTLGLVFGISRVSGQQKSVESIVHMGKERMTTKFHRPSSMSGKLQLMSRVKTVDETKVDISDRVFEEDGNLRSLQMKNNFAGLSYFTDAACQNPHLVFGSLVNYCFNEVGTQSGQKRSYFLKINKKTHTFVELQFEGGNCRGIPDKVTDMFSAFLPDFTADMDYDQCFLDTLTGLYATANYWNTYPEFSEYSGGYYGQTYTSNKCTTKNKDYFEFWYQEYVDIPTGCVAFPEDGNSLFYNECGPDGWCDAITIDS